MTQQFNFGDRVRYKDEENPVLGVVLEEANPGNGLITVQFIDDAEPELVGSEDLEYVPHPDTVRLDWLADPTNKIGSVLLPAECVEQHLDSLRDAIDAAMQIQAEEAEDS